MKKIFTLALIISASVFFSCSLRYGEEVSSTETTPEFTFQNVTYTIYQNGGKTFNIECSQLEQYQNSSSYANDATFTSWNNLGQKETTGSCNLISIETNQNIYTLYGDISVNNLDQNLLIQTDYLKWNNNSQQLQSNNQSLVTIQKDDLTVTGTGFSASGVSKTYTFNSNISGTLIQEEPSNE